MIFEKIALLTTDSNWSLPFAYDLQKKLESKNINAKVFLDHKKISKDYPVVIMLSYGKIVEEQYLKEHTHNLIIHASDLPKGRGWSPYIWQIIEGCNEIIVTLFEAAPKVDAGDYLFTRTFNS